MVRGVSVNRDGSNAMLPSTRVRRYSLGSVLSPALVHILEEVQRELGCREVESDQRQITTAELDIVVKQVALRLGFELSTYERDEILTYLEQDREPFGLLQELVDNPEVSDIIITDYQHIAVQEQRRNFLTDISFPSESAYESFVERLLKQGGASLSTKRPIVDGMIGAFARVHAVHRCICEGGPYVTIRLNRFSSVVVDDLVQAALAPRAIFEYLSQLICAGKTVLVVGEVGTGKTTLTRALGATVSEQESILVIEDTPEIRLAHRFVRYLRTRNANTDGEGRVTPGECIRGGMRMAMNRIIFGEIRDAEAAEAFIDVCASGHPGLSTIHARSASEALVRLELFLGRAQKGVPSDILQRQIATAVQVIVFLELCSVTGRRRIQEVKEIGPVVDGRLRQRDMFRYETLMGQPNWRVLNKVSAFRSDLERAPRRVELAKFPATLQLEQNAAYREAVALAS